MSNPYGNQQQPYGQPPAQGNDPYAQQHAGYYGGQPYGPPGGGPVPQNGPTPQGPPPAAPIVWEDRGRPTSAPWSGPGAFAPPPAPPAAPERPAAPPEQQAAPRQHTPVPPPQPQAPAAAPPQPAPQAAAAEAPTASSPAVGGNDDQATDDALTIGRGRGNSIVLDDMLVSRQHVRITADDEGLVLEDLGSRNGTFVNGRRVERTHLHEGDHIGVGASTFEVRDGWLVTI